MCVCRWLGPAVAVCAAASALAAQLEIPYVSELAYDQPRVAVYLRDAADFLPHGTGGYAMPGLLDTGAAAHVFPKYLADIAEAPIDPAGQAEILTLCGYPEFLDITFPLRVGVGPYESEDESDFVEVGPHRAAVRTIDPVGAELLGFPAIIGTPFLKEYSVFIDWQLIEIWPGIELPSLVSTPRPAGQPAPAPVDLTMDLTMFGETNDDINLSLPTAWHVPFADVVLGHGDNRQRRRFIVDTGAQITFISSELALALGIDLDNPVPDSALPVVGAGACSVTLYGYFVDKLMLVTRQNVALVFIQPLVYVLDVPGIDGGIGSNTLFFFEELQAVDIDLHNRRIDLDLNVPVPLAGDLTGDGKCNIFDLQRLAASWNRSFGDPAYNELADVNLDARVNILDLQQLAKDWNKTPPAVASGP